MTPCRYFLQTPMNLTCQCTLPQLDISLNLLIKALDPFEAQRNTFDQMFWTLTLINICNMEWKSPGLDELNISHNGCYIKQEKTNTQKDILWLETFLAVLIWWYSCDAIVVMCMKCCNWTKAAIKYYSCSITRIYICSMLWQDRKSNISKVWFNRFRNL